jgi:flavodoxin
MFGKRKKALVVYYTKTGHTGEAAEAVARGLRESRVEVEVKTLDQVDPSDLEAYSIIAVGAPTWAARPARPMKKFLKGLDKKALKGKVAAPFTSYAGMRGKATLRRMRRLLRRRKAKKVLKGVAVKAGAPLSLWKGRSPSEEDLARLEELGRKLARS